jgi:archaellum component FlaF (FlaF/FlaG flagellin family)
MRRTISPFISTIILITATFMIGGFLFTQFQGFVNRYITQPSIEFTGVVAVPDSTSVTASIKNTGNVPLTITEVKLFINGGAVSITTNPPISTSPLTLQPGKAATISINTAQALKVGDTISIVVISDQITKGFTAPIT